jgi:hypothetical protein
MGHSKMSVTVPDEILKEIKEISASRNTRLNGLVTEALLDKINKIKEKTFISRINEIFQDPEVAGEQRVMAEDIANNTDVHELLW